MARVKSTVVTCEMVGWKKPEMPDVYPSRGNVPTKEEYDTLVEAFNILLDTLKERGVFEGGERNV